MSDERTTLFKGKYLALVKEGHWEYADRVGATGAAIIVAVTPEQKLLIVEQYRIPMHARTIELPAGITGDEGDTNRMPKRRSANFSKRLAMRRRKLRS